MLAWLAMAALAFLNGGLREVVMAPRIGDRPAHVASTALLAALIVAVAVTHHLLAAPTLTAGERWLVGALWSGATVAFEFGFFTTVGGESIATIAAQYDVRRGNVWVLVPLAALAAPHLAPPIAAALG
jgi:hypothetical protein